MYETNSELGCVSDTNVWSTRETETCENVNIKQLHETETCEKFNIKELHETDSETQTAC